MLYGENYCQLQLLFVLIVTDLPLLQGLFSVDASPAVSVGLGADVVHSHSIWFMGFFSRTLPGSGLTMSPNSFFGSYVVPFVRIVKITLSILQAITMGDCIFFSGFCFLVV